MWLLARSVQYDGANWLAVVRDDRHVGVGELDALGAERAQRASPACRRARRRPGRRARRTGRREGRARGIARSCGSSRRGRCCRRSGTARPRRKPARRRRARRGVDASSLTMQTKSRCVCSRIDRICLARRSSAGSYVAMQTAIVGVIGAGTVAGAPRLRWCYYCHPPQPMRILVNRRRRLRRGKRLRRPRDPPPALGATPRLTTSTGVAPSSICRGCARPAFAFVHGDVRDREDVCWRSVTVDAVVEASAEPSVLAGSRRRRRLRSSGRTSSAPSTASSSAGATTRSSSSCRRAACTRSRALDGARLLGDGDPVRARRRAAVPGPRQRGSREAFPLDGAARSTGRRSSPPSSDHRVRRGLRPAGRRSTGAASSPGPGRWARSTRASSRTGARAPLRAGRSRYIGFGGSGKQVRDLLHVDDLVELARRAARRARALARARSCNVGGGRECSLSLLELTAALPRDHGQDGRRSALNRTSVRATCRSTSPTAPPSSRTPSWRPQRDAPRDPRGHSRPGSSPTRRRSATRSTDEREAACQSRS